MSSERDGVFSSSWMSLQIQLKGLLEGAGGEGTLKLLDSLSALGEDEQRVVIKILTAAVERMTANEKRLLSERDQQMQKMEDALVEDILKAFEENQKKAPNTGKNRKFSVVEGGRNSHVRNLPPEGPPRGPSKVRNLPFIA